MVYISQYFIHALLGNYCIIFLCFLCFLSSLCFEYDVILINFNNISMIALCDFVLALICDYDSKQKKSFEKGFEFFYKSISKEKIFKTKSKSKIS